MSFGVMLLLQSEAVLPAFVVVSLLFILGITLLVVAVKTLKIVPQATVMLVERLGRFSRVAASGLNILVPFIDKPSSIFERSTVFGCRT